ncbi:MAG: 2,5-diamino-6-(ribosylamino)-4(3H)-pyrimidinone 5'-phosphate reductase [Euryarchaeota archaeon]|nr:2,5-diamino-6-(ribosylamino)-4(3H)-pyrimidinone 5'-phosphate reductase [Euryarchaeota archaeon]
MENKIIINCAMSADGKIALPNRKQIRLSNQEDLQRVNELRENCDAILVGIGTVIEDNPNLTIKGNKDPSNNPVRVILDTKGRTPLDSHVLNNQAKTVVAVGNNCNTKKLGNAEIINCGDDLIDIQQLIDYLAKMGIKNILVEGGETVLWSFLNENLFDEINIFVASMIVGGEKTPTMAGGSGFATKLEALKLNLETVGKLGDGVLLTYRKK